MNGKKLFKVLVLGGAPLGLALGCGGQAGSPQGPDQAVKVAAADKGIVSPTDTKLPPWLDAGKPSLPDLAAPQLDGNVSPSADAVAADTGTASDMALTNGGFCPNEVACEKQVDESWKPRPGFFCCWATSC
jgi:hypothetical protein